MAKWNIELQSEMNKEEKRERNSFCNHSLCVSSAYLRIWNMKALNRFHNEIKKKANPIVLNFCLCNFDFLFIFAVKSSFSLVHLNFCHFVRFTVHHLHCSRYDEQLESQMHVSIFICISTSIIIGRESFQLHAFISFYGLTSRSSTVTTALPLKK